MPFSLLHAAALRVARVRPPRAQGGAAAWRWRGLACGLIALAASGHDLPGQSARTDSTAPRPVVARVADPGPGAPGRILRDVVRRPHRVVAARDRWALLGPADASDRSVIVVHGSARVDTRVEGDVVVVDGDLRLGRGAVIAGRAVAIGGHVFRTPFSVVRGGIQEYPDDRFDAVPVREQWRLGWSRLDSLYASPPLRLPGFAGFRVAAYSRVDGLGLTWGPQLAAGPLTVRPAATWRTHRGRVDPSVTLRLGSRRFAAEAEAARTTVSNEQWIAGDLVAASVGLLTGLDLRNWYRTDRAEGRIRMLQDSWPIAVELWAGGRDERVLPPQPLRLSPTGPWTFATPTPGNGFDRVNPAVASQRLTTAIAGLGLATPIAGGMQSRLVLQAEVTAHEWDNRGRFMQVVSDWTSVVPTGGRTRLESIGHAAWHTGDLPAARLGAVGGPGTLLTERVLALRGERLVFGAARWVVPLGERALLPRLALRAARGLVGDAARWQRGVTNVGVQVDVGPVRLEYAYDPAARRGAAVVVTSLVPSW